MKKVRLIDFHEVSPVRSQTVYHAAGYALTEESPDTIILVSSNQPYVCIGYHQDLEKEVDLGYCQAHSLPVMRREVGGGAVYLDDGQMFTQWVFRRGQLPQALDERFKLYVQPLVETYRELGIEAYHRPINDIHVAGKKIGGTGAAQMGQSEIVVGSLMFDFDKATMAKVLKVSSEKMRDKIFESLEQYMTTMREQLGQRPDRQTVKDLYIQKCEEALGVEIYEGEWTEAEEAMAADREEARLHAAAAEIDDRFLSSEWLYQKGGLRQVGVKIHEDVRVVEAALKAPGGLIRVTVRLREGHIDDLALSGDFTLLPSFAIGSLEQATRGLRATQEALRARLGDVYRLLNIQSPGVTPDDFTNVILNAAGQV